MRTAAGMRSRRAMLDAAVRAIAICVSALAWGCTGELASGGLPQGAPCTRSAECATSLCATDFTTESGTCATPCAAEDGCAPRSCVPARGDDEAGAFTRGVTVCATVARLGTAARFAPCGQDGDCARGICVADQCTEVCDGCDGRAQCERVASSRGDVQVCVHDEGKPDLVLGPFMSTAEGALVDVDVPADVRSVTLTAVKDAWAPLQRVGVTRLAAPDGTVVYDFLDATMRSSPAAPPYPGASAVSYPWTDAAARGVAGGRYTVRVGLFEIDAALAMPFVPVAGQVDRLEVFFGRDEARPRMIDLELHWTPGTGVDAARAADDPFVREMLATTEGIYRDALGWMLGDVHHHVLDARFDSLATSDAVREMCATQSRPGPLRISVNVFVVGSIAFARGFTSGAPAPPGLYGLPPSGIALQKLATGAETGTLLAHELGHFLGLRHTTVIASDGAASGEDGLSDTPTCPSGTSASRCPDYPNLMFPFFAPNARLLTAAQRDVIRASRVAHP